MKPLPIAALLLALGSLACTSMPSPAAHSERGPADLVLRGGKIVTLEEGQPEAESIAIVGDRIVALGSDVEVAAWLGPRTSIVELQGRTVVPGFIEGHGHFPGLGHSLQILDLRAARSWAEVVEQVARAAESAAPGEWILGRGWHQEKWDQAPERSVEGFPTHHSLSAVAPDHPVCLRHASGHACFFNARAMELAGVDAGTPDPPGGEILRLPGGEPSGVFREKAALLVEQAHSDWLAQRPAEENTERLRDALRRADRECSSKGVTSFQDAGTDLATLAVMREMVENGELSTRLWVMVRDTNEKLRTEFAAACVRGLAQHHLTVRAIKRSLDGALGSRGAWLLEPYSDLPSSTGLNITTLESVAESARIALETDSQLCVHAIGDRANREMLDLYERVLGDAGVLHGDHRWRIEHAQHLAREDVPRFAANGIIASMQAVHCTSDGSWVPDRLGEQRAREGAYLWRDLIDSGALVTNGTDTPVEDVDPLASYYASVTRRLPSGELFYPDQSMGRLEALRAYTLGCATAAFEEDLKGSLRPGKLADLVVLSADILSVPAAAIPEARVDLTVIGGEIAYRRQESR